MAKITEKRKNCRQNDYAMMPFFPFLILLDKVKAKIVETVFLYFNFGRL
jgi:hypothetical protein